VHLHVVLAVQLTSRPQDLVEALDEAVVVGPHLAKVFAAQAGGHLDAAPLRLLARHALQVAVELALLLQDPSHVVAPLALCGAHNERESTRS
jgi:hypothetical protein